MSFDLEVKEFLLTRWEKQLEEMDEQARIVIYKSDLAMLLHWARERMEDDRDEE